MADYGVTENGFVRERLPEIREEILADFSTRLRAIGITESPSYSPDSVMGILIDTFAERETALWEMASGLWGAMYPNTASGISLDNAVSFTGVTRRKSEGATGYVYFYGQSGSSIQYGTEVKNSKTGGVWTTTEEKTISQNHVTDLTVTFEDKVAGNTEYGITLNGENYNVTSPDIPVRTKILEQIAAQIDKQIFTVSVNDDRLNVTTLSEEDFSYSLTRLKAEKLGIRVAITTDGEDVANSGDINRAENSISGIDTVTNKTSTTAARGEESDTELRKRYETGVFRTGAATLPSLRPNIFNNVPGVRDCAVFENDSSKPDSFGRLPHSVHYVVYGGSDNDIAEEIHARKAAGIDSHGRREVKISKPYGEFKIRFDRPTLKFVWLKITINKNSSNDVLSLNKIKEMIFNSAQKYHIGEPVPPSRLLCPVFALNEVKNADIIWALTDTEIEQPLDWKSGLIPASPVELLLFSESRIDVEVMNDI